MPLLFHASIPGSEKHSSSVHYDFLPFALHFDILKLHLSIHDAEASGYRIRNACIHIALGYREIRILCYSKRGIPYHDILERNLWKTKKHTSR